MNKKIILGIILGILCKELTNGIMPVNAIYLDVMAGAFVATFVGERLLLGLTIALYAIAWKLIGAIPLTSHYGVSSVGHYSTLFFLDYLEVSLMAIVGCFFASLACKIISKCKEKKEQVSA